jgi:hypothetical protein
MAASKRKGRKPRRFTFLVNQEEFRLLRMKAADEDVSASELLRRMIRACLGLPEPDESDEQEHPPRGR